SKKAQWLNPVQLGTAPLLDLSTQSTTLLGVLEVLEKLEPDEVMEFVKNYYKTGLKRFGDSWNYADSLTVLYVAAKLLQPQTYLEIGVFHGRSMATVASLAPNCQLYGFDLWIEGYAA